MCIFKVICRWQLQFNLYVFFFIGNFKCDRILNVCVCTFIIINNYNSLSFSSNFSTKSNKSRISASEEATLSNIVRQQCDLENFNKKLPCFTIFDKSTSLFFELRPSFYLMTKSGTFVFLIDFAIFFCFFFRLVTKQQLIYVVKWKFSVVVYLRFNSRIKMEKNFQVFVFHFRFFLTFFHMVTKQQLIYLVK